MRGKASVRIGTLEPILGSGRCVDSRIACDIAHRKLLRLQLIWLAMRQSIVGRQDSEHVSFRSCLRRADMTAKPDCERCQRIKAAIERGCPVDQAREENGWDECSADDCPMLPKSYGFNRH